MEFQSFYRVFFSPLVPVYECFCHFVITACPQLKVSIVVFRYTVPRQLRHYVHISYVSVELKKPSVGLNLCCMLGAEEQTDGNISGFDLYCLNPAPFIVLSVKVLITPKMFRLSSQRLLRFDDRIITLADTLVMGILGSTDCT